MPSSVASSARSSAASSAATSRIVAAELRTIDADTAGRHYEEHAGKPFYGDLVAFITRGPRSSLVVEGPEDTWKVVRTMMGATNPREAAPGTIRGDLGIEFTENLVHGSDGPESAAREIELFFPGSVGGLRPVSVHLRRPSMLTARIDRLVA